MIFLTPAQYRQLKRNTQLFIARELIPWEHLIQLNQASPDDEHDDLVELMYLTGKHTAVCSYGFSHLIEIKK